MSKRLIVANVILAGLAVFFATLLVRDLSHSRALPLPRAPRPAQTAVAAPPATAVSETLTSYNVIPAKSLFSPTRGEGPAAAAAPTVPLPPKPVLLGVVVDEPRSVAYLEDPSTKRILAYRVGDSVAGGRLEKIAGDRVVIRRADGQIDVLLSDPAKLPVGPVAPGMGAGPTPPGVPPGRPVTAPPVRAPRLLPSEQPTNPQQ